MKTLGEAALDLPWIAPCVASLTSLARFPFRSVWSQVRTDPGIVLLFARLPNPACDLDISVLDGILQHRSHFALGSVAWNTPAALDVHRACCLYARAASRLAATKENWIDQDRAWIAGFLAPLGLLALTAADPSQARNGIDHAALARRLARSWRLPTWLAPIVGQLALPATIAEQLGADASLFSLVQLAVRLVQEREGGADLSVGTSLPDLLGTLRLTAQEAHASADQALAEPLPAQSWESPANQPLLIELLGGALDHRRQNDAAWIERLQQEVDHLHAALTERSVVDDQRLHAMKLSSLAEFAAGAGHEINNPLAVISGQAQYVLKQMDWLDGPADEIDNIAEYLDNLRKTITPSLHKIIGQTQRIHGILTEVMQFARPSVPKLQVVSAAKLMREVGDSLQPFAQEHQVELTIEPSAHDVWLHADPQQARVALAGLIKNAIEAAPAEGWVRLSAVNDRPGLLDLIVEDNGSGVSAAVQEHMFDPFYCGRSAGRGRGMGLPTAWRLAIQQRGEVRYDGHADGVTRFALTLPMTAPPPPINGHANGILARSAGKG